MILCALNTVHDMVEIMTRTTVTELIKVPSSMLNTDLKNNIMMLLRAKEGTCTKKHGCILTIVSIDRIYSARICVADAMNHCLVEYTYDSFMPVVDVVYNATVFKSYSEGILLNINGCSSIRALTNPGPYKPGDSVHVTLKEIQYSDDAYMCVGDHVKLIE